MTDELMLSMLKISLGIVTTAYDQRLAQCLKTAKAEIEREGAALSAGSVSDCNLIIQYAEWMWRKRESGEGMPRMIRWQINNRIFDMGGGSNG